MSFRHTQTVKSVVVEFPMGQRMTFESGEVQCEDRALKNLVETALAAAAGGSYLPSWEEQAARKAIETLRMGEIKEILMDEAEVPEATVD